MVKLLQIKSASVLLAVFWIVLLASVSFAAVETDAAASPQFLPDTSFMFPLGADINVRWVIPPLSKGKPEAGFSVSDNETLLIGYGDIFKKKFLMSPAREYVFAVDTGFTGFTHLENGMLLLANGNDIGRLARPKQSQQNNEGIPVIGFQPITSVPVSNCDVFGSFDNVAYCAGASGKTGEQELYVLRVGKESGPKELEKVLTSGEEITAVTGDADAVFVALGRRILRIDPKNKDISLYYQHPSDKVRGLAYSAESGLFVSTGEELMFIGASGMIEIMRAPGHQIAMRNGSLYVFSPRTFALFALENLKDLKRFDLAIRPVVADDQKSLLSIKKISFFESAPPPYKHKQYSDTFERKAVRSIVGQIDYRAVSPLKGERKHMLTVSWFEPVGGLLMTSTYAVTLQPKSLSGTIYAPIGGEKERDGYVRANQTGGWIVKVGPDALGTRYPGKYRVTVQVDGIPAGDAFFTLSGTAAPFEALYYDDPETMKRLLSEGLNPNSIYEKGATLLHQAADYGTPRMIELLLKNGADPNTVDNDKRPVLAGVMYRASDWREKADLLISHGAQVNTADPIVHGPLSEPKLYYLIEKGASVHAIDTIFKLPVLALSVRDDALCTDRLFSLLMKRGANLETKDKWGGTPLVNAIESNKPDCVRQLLNRGASITDGPYHIVGDINPGKHSMLFMALHGYFTAEQKDDGDAILKRANIVRMLLEKGVELKPSEGWIVIEGSVATLLDGEMLYKGIISDDFTLAKAAHSSIPEIRQLAIRGYVERAKKYTASAADLDDMKKAFEICNTARRLYEEGGSAKQTNTFPEIYLYCGLIETRFDDTHQIAAADLKKYLSLVPDADNAGEVKDLLRTLGDDTRNPSIETAIACNSRATVDSLIAQGLEMNAKGKSGQTPLQIAVNKGSREIVELLITKGANVNARSDNGDTLLDEALREHSEEIAELLVARGADINARDKKESTPLHKAVVNNQIKIAEMLIAKGADVNAKDAYGRMPLSYASKDLAEMLKRHGARDDSKVSEIKQTAVEKSDGNDERTLLILAIERNDMAAVESLIEKGADVAARDNTQSTPLQRAAYKGNTKIAELLITKGADINAKDISGYTPLRCAVWSNKKEMLELLIAKGADINAKDKKGQSHLHVAVWDNKKEMAELLIAKGADINAKEKDGYTPLGWAGIFGRKEMAELLKKHGARE